MAAQDDDWLEDDTDDAGTVAQLEPWNVLVVDDEPDIHHVTRLALTNISFLGRPLNILSCYSGREAIAILKERHDIALMLLDVVMETEDAGLKVARIIREELHNHCIRIILRTGQPGVAPERHVIESYDINDYKAKTELTRDKLYTAVLGTLRSYNDIMTIEHQRRILEANRRGLIKVVEASTTIFRQQSIQQFAQGVLEQLQALLFFEQEALFVVVNGGMTALTHDDKVKVMYATGGYQNYCGKELDDAALLRFKPSIDEAIAGKRTVYAPDHFVGFFQAPHGPVNLLIIDGPVALSHPDADLIELFCKNVAIAYENLMLTKEIEDTQRSIIYQLSEVVESRSTDTGKHIHRMAEFAYVLARELGLDEQEAQIIKAASPLHDIGKVGIPDRVLNKPGRLDEEERKIMDTHAELGYRMLKDAKPRILRMAATIAHEHHEKWDGSGYPRGLKGEDIHIAGRIIALADVFDALTHARCYKPAWPPADVIKTIDEGSGTHFDPRVVEAFLRSLPAFEAIVEQYQDSDPV
ncbi:response regulator [Chitinilyticum litopenaei]|uniref:response regulator n=1 Tax=Chitinilyticum litopenaei TaxID=1121276 RepID=UPI0003FAEF04|nr:response regulator [Chitinilyticum litopenaei]